MAVFKPLLDNECGVTNPLISLSQLYTQDGMMKKNDESIHVPNTFHLETLLTSLCVSDKNDDEWTKEFLHSEPISWSKQNYLPSSSSSFIFHPNPILLEQQQPSLIYTEVDNDVIEATQNILSFLHERQNAVDNEDKTLVENPFQEGLKCLEIHDITQAISFFKSAVQQKPDHIDAWLYLGITHMKNEQDIPAIHALKKCIELDSKNLQAYITLASCYANEMLIKESIDSLYKWLLNNNKYSIKKTIDELTFENLRDLFLETISLGNNSNEIDPDLQVCLGILFYLQNDYEKAAECFQTAVLIKPNDALLWNKLGAAIANSGHTEKAVNAYYHALTLSPDFIRARYNLGISCLNLNADKQAIEHFLIALKQQSNGPGTEAIWHTLACAINRLKRLDLEQYVVYRNLPALLHEFEMD